MQIGNKKIVSALLCGLLMAGGASAQQVIRFGTDATYPPFESTTASGEIVGFDIDLAKAMCEVMKAKCTFSNQAWDGIIPGLLAKKYDVIASSMSVTPERQKAVLFTKRIWATPNVFVGKAGIKQDTTVEALKGVDVGVQQATIQDRYQTKHYKDTNIKRYKTIEAAFADLATGRLKIVFSEAGAVMSLLESKQGKSYQTVGKPLTYEADTEIFGPGTGFALRKSDTKLAEEFNKAIDTIHANGTYKKLASKYFKFDVTPVKINGIP